MALATEYYGPNIRTARTNAGFTQVELAEYLGIDQRVLSKWETDAAEPSNSMLKAIALACGVSVDQLVGIEPLGPKGGVDNLQVVNLASPASAPRHTPEPVPPTPIRPFTPVADVAA